MWRWLGLVFTLISTSTTALTLEQTFVLKVSLARAKSDVERLQADFDEMRMLRLACRLQLHLRQVPASCYESLQREVRWELISPTQRISTVRELDERCRKATMNLRIPAATSSLITLSEICRQSVVEARRTEDYRSGRLRAWSEN